MIFFILNEKLPLSGSERERAKSYNNDFRRRRESKSKKENEYFYAAAIRPHAVVRNVLFAVTVDCLLIYTEIFKCG